MTAEIEMADASECIRGHRERKEKLETVAEMSEFLKTSEMTETMAFVGSLVKEIVVKPRRAAIVYWIPTPDDSPIEAAENALNGRFMNSVRHGGAGGTRTPGLHSAIVALSQTELQPLVLRQPRSPQDLLSYGAYGT